jgi:hypothetical protein
MRLKFLRCIPQPAARKVYVKAEDCLEIIKLINLDSQNGKVRDVPKIAKINSFEVIIELGGLTRGKNDPIASPKYLYREKGTRQGGQFSYKVCGKLAISCMSS